MSGQHTPGPWTLETVRTTSGMCHKVGPFPWRNGQMNHACIYVDGSFTNSRTSEIAGELAANARLIAAAPDLLDAAKQALAIIREIQDEEGFSPSTSVPAAALTAAIAKARGAA